MISFLRHLVIILKCGEWDFSKKHTLCVTGRLGENPFQTFVVSSFTKPVPIHISAIGIHCLISYISRSIALLVFRAIPIHDQPKCDANWLHWPMEYY